MANINIPSKTYDRDPSSEEIRTLQPNYIFVFNNNPTGDSRWRTAVGARRHHGAALGVANGMTGQCYSISVGRSLQEFSQNISQFIAFARKNPDFLFLVTPVGCGAAGYTVSQIAPLFMEAVEVTNIHLPKSFVVEVNRIIEEHAAAQITQVTTIGTYNREFTPEMITTLQPNEVFVFGSNIRGQHIAGAAHTANAKFGAEWGVGEGLTGQCYALPTMEGGVDYIAGKVQNFLTCAKEHPEMKFYVTKIACGIAGFPINKIAPLFADAIGLQNVILPREFVEILQNTTV